VGGTAASYTYDGDGTRVSKTVDEVETPYPARAPLTIALERAFRRLSTGDAIPLDGGITLITNCRGLCELVQDDAFTIDT